MVLPRTLSRIIKQNLFNRKQLQEYVKVWMFKRQLVKDFEQFIKHETKELVREEITYNEFDRGCFLQPLFMCKE